MTSEFDAPFQTKLRSIVLPLMTADAIDPLEPRLDPWQQRRRRRFAPRTG